MNWWLQWASWRILICIDCSRGEGVCHLWPSINLMIMFIIIIIYHISSILVFIIDLQKFSIWILSQTCNASWWEYNWSGLWVYTHQETKPFRTKMVEWFGLPSIQPSIEAKPIIEQDPWFRNHSLGEYWSLHIVGYGNSMSNN